MKKEEKKKPKLGTGRVISNCWFVVRLISKAAPAYLPLYYMWSVYGALVDFLSGAYLISIIVSCIGKNTPLYMLIIYIGVLFVLNFGGNLFFSWYNNCKMQVHNLKIRAAIQKSLFDKAEKVELACYETPEFYDKYVKAMDEAYNRSMNVVYTIDNIIYNIVSLAANSFLVFSIDPRLALFIAVPVLFGLIRRAGNKKNHDFWSENQKINRKYRYIRRTFYLGEYAKEMRLTGIGARLIAKYGEIYREYLALLKKYGFIRGTYRFILNAGFELLCVLAPMGYSAYNALELKQITVGDCAVIFNSMDSIFSSVSYFVSNMSEFHDHALYIEDYRYFLAYEPKIKENSGGPAAVPGELRLENVSFRYEGADTDSLKGINLCVKPGEKIALVGQNGSGKSTLVKLMTRLYEPTEGKITLSGDDVRELNSKSYTDLFCAVFQDFKLLSLPVIENILLRPVKDGDRELVTEALKKSGGYDVVSGLEHGIDTIVTREFDEKGAMFSGGETQKITLARIFTNNSPFVILDEPSSALDPIAEYSMFENMMDACKDRTVIFISHRLSAAVLADRVLLMEDGRISESGTHRELMERGGSYASMFHKQARNYVESGVKSDE